MKTENYMKTENVKTLPGQNSDDLKKKLQNLRGVFIPADGVLKIVNGSDLSSNYINGYTDGSSQVLEETDLRLFKQALDEVRAVNSNAPLPKKKFIQYSNHFVALYYDEDNKRFIIVDTLGYDKSSVINFLSNQAEELKKLGYVYDSNNNIIINNVYFNGSNNCVINAAINLDAIEEVLELAKKKGIEANKGFLENSLRKFYNLKLSNDIKDLFNLQDLKDKIPESKKNRYKDQIFFQQKEVLKALKKNGINFSSDKIKQAYKYITQREKEIEYIEELSKKATKFREALEDIANQNQSNTELTNIYKGFDRAYKKFRDLVNNDRDIFKIQKETTEILEQMKMVQGKFYNILKQNQEAKISHTLLQKNQANLQKLNRYIADNEKINPNKLFNPTTLGEFKMQFNESNKWMDEALKILRTYLNNNIEHLKGLNRTIINSNEKINNGNFEKLKNLRKSILTNEKQIKKLEQKFNKNFENEKNEIIKDLVKDKPGLSEPSLKDLQDERAKLEKKDTNSTLNAKIELLEEKFKKTSLENDLKKLNLDQNDFSNIDKYIELENQITKERSALNANNIIKENQRLIEEWFELQGMANSILEANRNYQNITQIQDQKKAFFEKNLKEIEKEIEQIPKEGDGKESNIGVGENSEVGKNNLSTQQNTQQNTSLNGNSLLLLKDLREYNLKVNELLDEQEKLNLDLDKLTKAKLKLEGNIPELHRGNSKEVTNEYKLKGIMKKITAKECRLRHNISSVDSILSEIETRRQGLENIRNGGNSMNLSGKFIDQNVSSETRATLNIDNVSEPPDNQRKKTDDYNKNNTSFDRINQQRQHSVTVR